MGGEYEISGVIDGGVVIVKTTEPFDDGYSPKESFLKPVCDDVKLFNSKRVGAPASKTYPYHQE